MLCPHCHNEVQDGANICPKCSMNLMGETLQYDENEECKAPKKKRSKKTAYKKGSRGGRKHVDQTMMTAFGLGTLLLVLIILIVKPMFGSTSKKTPVTVPNQVKATSAPQNNTPSDTLVVFGATTAPSARPAITPTPVVITVTPTPSPVANTERSYATLRKGDEGPAVMTMQQALIELGYLTGTADGKFGAGTQTSVKKFQEENQLDADGIAGKKTLEVLYSKATVTPMPAATVGPDDILDLPG